MHELCFGHATLSYCFLLLIFIYFYFLLLITMTSICGFDRASGDYWQGWAGDFQRGRFKTCFWVRVISREHVSVIY